jgi:hypothetical protein
MFSQELPMPPKELFATVLLNLIAGALIGGLLVGFIGFLAAGWAGVLNGLIFGAAFGILGGIATSAYVGFNFWEGFAHRLGASLRKDDKPQAGAYGLWLPAF